MKSYLKYSAKKEKRKQNKNKTKQLYNHQAFPVQFSFQPSARKDFFRLQHGSWCYQHNLFLLKERKERMQFMEVSEALATNTSIPPFAFTWRSQCEYIIYAHRKKKYFNIISELHMYHFPWKYANTDYANPSLFCTYLQYSPPISQTVDNLMFAVKYKMILGHF